MSDLNTLRASLKSGEHVFADVERILDQQLALAVVHGH